MQDEKMVAEQKKLALENQMLLEAKKLALMHEQESDEALKVLIEKEIKTKETLLEQDKLRKRSSMPVLLDKFGQVKLKDVILSPFERSGNLG